MKQEKDWLESMGRSLRDAEVTPPAGGWDRLARELGGSAPVASTKAPHWRIYLVGATSIAALLVVGLFVGKTLQRPSQSVETHLPALAGVTTESAPAVSSVVSETAEKPLLAQVVTTPTPKSAVSKAHRSMAPQTETASIEMLTADAQTEPTMNLNGASVQNEPDTKRIETTPVEPQIAPKAEPTAAQPVESDKASKAETNKQAPVRSYASARTVYPDEFAETTSKHHETSLSLFGGSGVVGKQASPSVPNLAYSDAMDSNDELVASLSKQYRTNYKESSFTHHQPIGFGLTIRKAFAHGLSVESGVTYTFLRSDVELPYSTDKTSQKLHMIGIPVRLNWQCFNRGRFSLYLGAGGMAEKCVLAKLGSDKITEKGLQWSLQGAFGGEYRLTSPLSLYFEPEASYYLTETYLRTARTETPLSVTLRLGLRMTF